MANQNDQPQRIDDDHDAFEDSSIEGEMIALCIAVLVVFVAVIVCSWFWPRPTMIVTIAVVFAFWMAVIVRKLRE